MLDQVLDQVPSDSLVWTTANKTITFPYAIGTGGGGVLLFLHLVLITRLLFRSEDLEGSFHRKQSIIAFWQTSRRDRQALLIQSVSIVAALLDLSAVSSAELLNSFTWLVAHGVEFPEESSLAL